MLLQAARSAAYKKYEIYKHAGTIGEARELGADNRSLAWDFQRRFLTLLPEGDLHSKSIAKEEPSAEPLQKESPAALAAPLVLVKEELSIEPMQKEAPAPVPAAQRPQMRDQGTQAARGLLKRRRVRQEMCRRAKAKRPTASSASSRYHRLRKLMYQVSISKRLGVPEPTRLRMLATAISFLSSLPDTRTLHEVPDKILVLALLENAFSKEGRSQDMDHVRAKLRTLLKVSSPLSEASRSMLAIAKMVSAQAAYGEDALL